MTYVHNIRVPGMLHGRVVRPRGQGAYGDGTSPKVVSVDESSIKHIKGAQVVRFGDYFVGVVRRQEYAAIQAAAQLKVKWADMPAIPSSGNLWKGMRDQDNAGKAPARDRGQQGQLRHAPTSRRRRRWRSRTSSTTRATCRSARRAASPTSRRAALASSRTARICTRTRGLIQTVLAKVKPERNLPDEPDPPDLRRGLERLRLGAVQRREPGGGDHVGPHREAGAPPVHALGRARLGQLRPRPDDRHPRGHRRQRQHHRVRVHALRHPVLDDAAGPAAGAGQLGGVRDRRAAPRRRSAARSTRSRTGG